MLSILGDEEESTRVYEITKTLVSEKDIITILQEREKRKQAILQEEIRKHFMSFLLVLQLEQICSVTGRISVPPRVLPNTREE